MSAEMILPDDPRAAERKQLWLWVSRTGEAYSDDSTGERIARYDGSTHSRCDGCGSPCEKSRIRCVSCQKKTDDERYAALPFQEWDGDTPLAIFGSDDYFFDLDDVEMYCDTHDCAPEDLQLVLCNPNNLSEIDSDYWCDDLPEDGDLPPEIEKALAALNSTIREYGKAVSWFPGKIRTQVKI